MFLFKKITVYRRNPLSPQLFNRFFSVSPVSQCGDLFCQIQYSYFGVSILFYLRVIIIVYTFDKIFLKCRFSAFWLFPDICLLLILKKQFHQQNKNEQYYTEIEVFREWQGFCFQFLFDAYQDNTSHRNP